VDNFAVILIARFAAGVGAGLIWSNLGGYAARLVPEQFQGKAIAIAMAGIPAALSLGLPLGTTLGDAAGWQAKLGVTVSSAQVRSNGAQLAELGRLLESGTVRVAIDSTFALADARAAHERAARGHIRGKIVLTIA
jgi:NADPH:quinone reductase-like Zn-dependent oxidoreductase